MSAKEDNAFVLSDELQKEVIRLASQVAIKQFQRQSKIWKKEVMDRCLHNTELLMKNYRSFVVHSEMAVYDASQINDDIDLNDLLEMMGSRRGDNAASILSIQESAVRTRTLVVHIDRMLDYFKYRCEHSERPDDKRYWLIIYWRYVVEEGKRKSFQELANEEGLGLSSIYKSHKEAIRQLSALFFGYIAE